MCQGLLDHPVYIFLYYSLFCFTHRLVEETLVWLFIFPSRAVEEAVAERTVVDAAVQTAEVGRRARETLHAVVCARTF
jgi:hypothetical protein